LYLYLTKCNQICQAYYNYNRTDSEEQNCRELLEKKVCSDTISTALLLSSQPSSISLVIVVLQAIQESTGVYKDRELCCYYTTGRLPAEFIYLSVLAVLVGHIACTIAIRPVGPTSAARITSNYTTTGILVSIKVYRFKYLSIPVVLLKGFISLLCCYTAAVIASKEPAPTSIVYPVNRCY
jgi:hypothetical protein